jgi:hypothetical protein
VAPPHDKEYEVTAQRNKECSRACRLCCEPPFLSTEERVENVADLKEVKIFRATVLKPFSSNSQTTSVPRETGISQG